MSDAATVVITVDVSSAVPPFEQVRGQLATLISTAALTTGQRLPTVRQLARDLDLAPGTIARAFRELEQAGLVKGGGARGTTVMGPAEARLPAPVASRLDGLTASYLASARSLGYTGEAILAAVQEALLTAQ